DTARRETKPSLGLKFVYRAISVCSASATAPPSAAEHPTTSAKRNRSGSISQRRRQGPEGRPDDLTRIGARESLERNPCIVSSPPAAVGCVPSEIWLALSVWVGSAVGCTRK